ncbi:MAG: hypothetical protein IPK52_27500 [Chloroflexi bacterium]|nr:hypothetical protein [Chloroflexota bacterium]
MNISGIPTQSPTITMLAPGRCESNLDFDADELRPKRLTITCDIPHGISYIGLQVSAKTRAELLEGAALDRLMDFIRTALLSDRDVFLMLRGDALPADQLPSGLQQLIDGHDEGR